MVLIVAGVLVIMAGAPAAGETPRGAEAATRADDAAGDSAGRLVYVTHAQSEDIATFTVGRDGRPRRLGDLVTTGGGTSPASVLFAPDGRTAYVLNRGNNTVAAYRVSSRGELRLLGAAPTGDAFGLAIAPDGSSLFAANQSGTVSAFTVNDDGTPRPAGDPVPTGFPLPQGLAVSPDGRFLYIAHGEPDSPGPREPDVIVRFAIGPNAALKLVGRPVQTNPSGAQIVFTPDGRFAYIATTFDSVVDGFRVGRHGELSPLPGSPYDAALFAEGAVITPDGRHLFVAGSGNGPNPGGLSAYTINNDGTLTEVPGSPFPAGMFPVGVDTTPDGRHLLVSSGNGDPSLLFTFAIATDGRLNQTGPPMSTGGTISMFQSLAVQPNQGPTAVFTLQARPAGHATRFDASAASDPDGHIARFDWDFGDGTTLHDGGPTPAHTYRRPGKFTATVTVTDNENCSTALVFTGTTAHCNGSPRARSSQTITIRP
ncbi:beta-propeller fold lactonase family protein [Acrocarpospora macrocephala]|uniref:beta-propeller fold lactonase family protein n=1 Tax=Acrocarpospora macrocephala TaxID=150177 RepID=UPI0012D2BDE3|nr:beta-propeller fold lactonase family protein [Acrocarpospora macrocephala]